MKFDPEEQKQILKDTIDEIVDYFGPFIKGEKPFTEATIKDAQAYFNNALLDYDVLIWKLGIK